MRLNSQGFREQEEQPVVEPGSVRIMVLGDSFAFGFGVRIEDRLTEVMERTRGAVNCANFGVSGYSTDQELLVFRRFGGSIAADIVVLMYVANDQPANISRLGHGYPKPVFVLENDQLTLSNVPVPHARIRLRLKWELMRRSALFNLIRERTEVVQGWFAPQPQPEVRRPVAQPEIAELDAESLGREMTRRLVLELNNESTRGGARFVVMNSVSAADLEIDPEAVALEKWCRSEGILWVDTYPAFSRRMDLEPDRGLFLRDRHHWNARGHEIAAVCLGQALEGAGLIPAEGRTEDPAGGSPRG